MNTARSRSPVSACRRYALVLMTTLAAAACSSDDTGGGLGGGLGGSPFNPQFTEDTSGGGGGGGLPTDATATADAGGAVCGNGSCDPGENAASCPADCSTGGGTDAGGSDAGGGGVDMGSADTSGNSDDGGAGGSDAGGEDAGGGSGDAGAGGDSGGGPVCGDGTCGAGENCVDCEADCGPCPSVCGDGTCEGTETCSTCPADCGACQEVCGNGTCGAGETCGNCEVDCGKCGSNCGNGTCSDGETCSTCPADCGACPVKTCSNPVTSPECAVNEQCYPAENDPNECLEAGPFTEGQSCNTLTACAKGHLCIGNLCRKLCDVSGQGGLTCNTGVCLDLMFGDNKPVGFNAGYCLPPDGCNGLTNAGCPDNENCAPVPQGNYCVPAGVGGDGAACQGDTDCQLGYICVGDQNSGQCRRKCHVQGLQPNCSSLGGLYQCAGLTINGVPAPDKLGVCVP